MTKQDYYSQVAEKLQQNVWEIELNKAFNDREIERLEQDINDGTHHIFIPGKDERDGQKLIGQMKQELTQRHRKREGYDVKIQALKERIDFIKTWQDQAE